MVTKKSWEEFRDSGLLWWINMILHTMGWSIVIETTDENPGKIEGVFPARVKFRGFSEKSNTNGYKKVSQYMKENVDELLRDAEE